MVFFIKSAAHKGIIRDFIRRTWAQISYVDGLQLSTVFLVGRVNNKLQPLIDEEYDRYQDILQLNVSDKYRWYAFVTLSYEVHSISFQTFLVWKLLLTVHTKNSSPLQSILLRHQCTCCTVPTTSGKPPGSLLV